MKIIYSVKAADWRVILDDDADYSCAVEVGNLLLGKICCKKCGTVSSLRAWEFLVKAFNLAKEAIIEQQRHGWRSRAGRTMADLRDSQMDGFLRASELPQDLVNQARLMQEATKKKEASYRGSQDDDGEI